ncbi:NADH-quinone oxidoreductase subunit NuoE [Candidatus Palauibacter sp.]|uniref:NADH-quinone oxidoreductase subunit NuoE family protein n=1 Tax=Candidatus Palauibacter sp. TaxID=3101350 RepID=UPI003B021352
MSRRLHPAVVAAQPFQLTARKTFDGPIFETEEGKRRLEMALSRYPTKQAALLPMLGFVQAEKGWIEPDDMVQVAEALDLTPAYVHSIATFYTMYNKHPVGRHLVQVCTNISCHLNRGEEVLHRFLVETGTREGEVSEDGEFTVIEAECLGACGFATVVQVNDRYLEDVTPDRVSEIVANLRGARDGATTSGADGGGDA